MILKPVRQLCAGALVQPVHHSRAKARRHIASDRGDRAFQVDA